MDAAVEKLGAAVDEWVRERTPALISTRRHLHAHPELAFAEFETTAFLEQRLRQAGLSPKRLPTGTGLVVEVGSGAPTVVLRGEDFFGVFLPKLGRAPIEVEQVI